MRMTSRIPPEITTPDSVETSLGTLAAAEIGEQHVIARLKEVLPTLTNASRSPGTREELGKGDRTLFG